jgi:cytochrome c oxidase subunit 2
MLRKRRETSGRKTGVGALRRRPAALLLVPATLLLASCSGSNQNSLAPQSHAARDIASLFWWMMGGAWIGLGVVVCLLLLAWKRRGKRGIGSDTSGSKPGERAAWYVVVGAGVVMPIILIATLFVISDIFVIQTTQAPAADKTKFTIRVIGHQWWWEVRYPGSNVVTANEIHIPVRTPVRVLVQSVDVIHSFWVPRLNRTIDAIPGRTNSIELYADKVGRYRGQCDEFCGLQHAHMAFLVFADPPATYQAWLARQARPATTPTSGLAQQGAKLFASGTCSSCHTIRGTSAQGYVGPDLTHVGSRLTLGALTVGNTPANLREWILESQHLKPGNQMPNIDVHGRPLDGLVAYLEGLK